MKIRVYEYKNCGTCKKALKYLESRRLKYEAIPIVDQPPTSNEIKQMLSFIKERGGSIKNLFNTSGELYREMKIADRLKSGMDESQAVQLLSKYGKLIKRPFVLTDKTGIVGFKEDEWERSLR